MISIMSNMVAIQSIQSLGERLLSRIAAIGYEQELHQIEGKAGQVLFRQGSKPKQLYFVSQGEVRLERMACDGSPILLQRITQGFVAEPSLTYSSYYCEGKCYSDTTSLIVVPIKIMRSAIDSDSIVRWLWIEMIGALARKQKLRAERLQLHTVRERIKHLIFTEGVGDGSYQLSGTRISLADELGVSPEALYRTIASLQQERLLEIIDSTFYWKMEQTSRHLNSKGC